MNLDSKNINFLVADDHSLIRQGMEFMIEELEFEGDVFHASSLQKVLETVETQPIDIVIIDAVFPDGNSLSIISQIKQIKPEIKILVFSGLDEHTQSLKYIKAGANGFLSKLSEEDDIKNAILKIHEQGKYLSAITQDLLLNSVAIKHTLHPSKILSEREFQIAEMYAKGLGNLEISANLDLKQNTVSTIKKRIFEKLKIDNILELVDLLKDTY